MLVVPESDAFVRLITNPAGFVSHVVETTDEALHRVRAYAFAVVKGNGTQPYCPIVKMVEEANAYRVRVISDALDAVDFCAVLDILERKYRELSPGPTFAHQELDLTTVVAAFADARCNEELFHQALVAMHAAHRLRFIEQGLMVAYMHPCHPHGSSSRKRADPGSDALYLAAIPLIVVRRMIPADDRFMRTPEEHRAYQRFFSSLFVPTGWIFPG